MRVVGMLTVVLLVTSCGQARGGNGSTPITSSCAVASGSYVNEAVLRSKEGTCTRAIDSSRDRLEFDQGVFVSPAAAFIPCKTEQAECELTVTCQVLDLEMVFRGEVMDEGARVAGVVTFSGKGECKSAIYDVEAIRPDPEAEP